MSTAGQAEGRAPSRLPAGALSIAVAAALLLALALAGAVAWNRDLQVDEIEHTYAAYSVHQGLKLYVDVWQAHPPLLYWMLAPLIEGSEPLATYRRERLLTFSIYLLGVALAGYCAARLAGGWAGVLAAGLGLLHTTWVERGMEIRPDGALGVAAVAALALELAPHGITVNCIPPGMIDTPMLRQAEARGDVGDLAKIAPRVIPVGRAGTPDDVAAACAYLCSDEAGFVTGQTVGVNGGLVL